MVEIITALFYLIIIAILFYELRKLEKESKLNDEAFYQKCKDISDIKGELEDIHEHFEDLSEDTLRIANFLDKTKDDK